ncbi:MAG: ribonuclease HII [Candidatus Nomurabacteria bacterium]|nr:ribonuclease HII [Candidatus Nomurabacteria bacterium]
MDKKFIIGIDEVGRGPVAGPVMVGAFLFLAPDFEDQIRQYSIENKLPLRDSKKLTKKQKDKWLIYFKDQKEKGNCDFSVSAVSAVDIDKIGIVPSIQRALNNSLKKVITKNNPASQDYNNFPRFTLKGSDTVKNYHNPVSLESVQVFLDGGLKAPLEYVNQETIIKGDELHPVISCASIVAKVTRDSMMEKYAQEYPDYGFENHVGYGTAAHYLAIKKHGMTPLHRKTFLKNIK